MQPEPWLRGILPDLDPVTGHLLRAAQQIREDATEALAPMTTDRVWAKPHGLTSAGFHAKHLAGSTRRLCTYLENGRLSPEQLAAIAMEAQGTESPAELIALIDEAFTRYEALVRGLSPADFGGIRQIGRRKLPTTAIGLAIHIAEHGQRHAGQLISAAKLAA